MFIPYLMKLYLDFNMDINICITLMYACNELNPWCLRWTVQWYIYLQYLLAVSVHIFFSLFFPKKKVQFNFETHLSLLFVYLLYFKIAMDNPIYIYIFFLLELLEISCLSNLNCHYLLLMWVDVASLYKCFYFMQLSLSICHFFNKNILD